MNKTLALVALTLLSGTAALAQSTSREQVIAELQRARANGELSALQSENTASFNPAAARSLSAKGKTRAEVLAELKQARANGSLDIIDGDVSGYPQLARIDAQPHGGQVLAGQPHGAQ